MKQTELKRTGGPKRSAMKRSQPKRDWDDARAKVEREGACRLVDSACPTTMGCDCPRDECDYECWGPLHTAHVVGREHDRPYMEEMSGYPDPDVLYVKPDSIVPLCLNHHRRYDDHELDLLPALTLDEQLQAVADAGGIELARKRLAPSQYRTAETPQEAV